MALAVIDLGTNTFHLLIAEPQGPSFHTLLRKRHSVKLGRNGLKSFSIAVIEEAQRALIDFRKILHQYPISALRIIGTSAMRTASNAYELIQFIEELFETNVEVIDGNKEAELIFKGVTHNNPPKVASLIMDIGGGSVEFIAFENEEIRHIESKNIGIGVLYNTLKFDDPVTQQQLIDAEGRITNQLESIIHSARNFGIQNLIGASGTFDLLYNLFKHPNFEDQIHIGPCLEHMNEFILSTKKERKNYGRFPDDRLDYIPVAYLLVRELVNALQPSNIHYTPYSLKEGTLIEMKNE